MPITLIVRNMGQITVAGGAEEAEAIVKRKREIVTVHALKNDHDVIVRTDEVLAAEIIPEAEYEQKQREAAEKAAADAERAAAEAKANPHPGAPPRLVVPTGKLPK